MNDTLVIVIVIFLAAILMFIFPLMSLSERTDDISQLAVQTAVTDFVNNARTKGKITLDDYSAFVQTLEATGNSYEIEMEVKHLDDNIGKKSEWTNGTVIGENVYYSVYTAQIKDELYKKNGKNVYNMKEGDIISVNVKNTNTTISQMLRNFFYSITGNNTYQIGAQSTGMVSGNGNI